MPKGFGHQSGGRCLDSTNSAQRCSGSRRFGEQSDHACGDPTLPLLGVVGIAVNPTACGAPTAFSDGVRQSCLYYRMRCVGLLRSPIEAKPVASPLVELRGLHRGATRITDLLRTAPRMRSNEPQNRSRNPVLQPALALPRLAAGLTNRARWSNVRHIVCESLGGFREKLGVWHRPCCSFCWRDRRRLGGPRGNG